MYKREFQLLTKLEAFKSQPYEIGCWNWWNRKHKDSRNWLYTAKKILFAMNLEWNPTIFEI